jgi:hypothetical protein
MTWQAWNEREILDSGTYLIETTNGRKGILIIAGLTSWAWDVVSKLSIDVRDIDIYLRWPGVEE